MLPNIKITKQKEYKIKDPMIPFRKIIYPMDYSDSSSIAPFVRSTVERFGAELAVVHAYGEEGLSFVDLPVATSDLPAQVQEFETLRLRDHLAEILPGFRAEVFAELGDAGTVIESVIERQGCDLLMLAAHDHGLIHRMLQGSVTAKVLHDASCAVWTATPAALAKSSPDYRKIVCAVDDNDEGKSVMVAGAAIAKEYGAQLAIVHVLDLPPMTMEIDYIAIKKELMEGKQARLREMVAGMNIDAPHSVIEGSVSHGLHEWLTEHHADLLITGRGHAQEGLGSALSNLYSIVRQAPCPVLSI